MFTQRTLIGAVLGLAAGGIAHSVMKNKQITKTPWTWLAAGVAVGAGAAVATAPAQASTGALVGTTLSDVKEARRGAKVAKAEAAAAAARAREAREETEQARGARRQEFEAYRKERARRKRFGETVDVTDYQRDVEARGGVVDQAAYREGYEDEEEDDDDLAGIRAGRITVGFVEEDDDDDAGVQDIPEMKPRAVRQPASAPIDQSMIQSMIQKQIQAEFAKRAAGRPGAPQGPAAQGMRRPQAAPQPKKKGPEDEFPVLGFAAPPPGPMAGGMPGPGMMGGMMNAFMGGMGPR